MTFVLKVVNRSRPQGAPQECSVDLQAGGQRKVGAFAKLSQLMPNFMVKQLARKWAKESIYLFISFKPDGAHENNLGQ